MFNNLPLSKGVSWYVNFYDLALDCVIYQKNADNTATPASNQKIITTAAYFALADTNFFHHTHFILASRSNTINISNGVFLGDVIISSNANPVISQTWYKDDTLDILLQQIVSSFSSKKISRIEGRLVGDNSFFSHSNYSFATFGEGCEYIRSWEWEDINVHASSISALSFNENNISISVTPTPNNRNEVIITSYPKNSPFKSYIKVVNFPTVPTITYNLIDEKVYVVGELFKKWTYSKNVKTPKPANFFLNYFQFLLGDSKVSVKLPSKFLSDSEKYISFDTLASIYSPKITVILKKIMKESSNFLSENIFYTMGALLFGQPGEYVKGIRAVKKFFFLAGIDTNQTKVVDGSGLSRHNAISPNTMIQILRFCYLANFFPSFKMTFPIAGIDGTLKERFSSSPLVGKVYAKTGSLSQIRSLSGYIDINEKTEIAFSIFATGILQSPLIIEDIIEKAVTEIFNWKKNHNP